MKYSSLWFAVLALSVVQVVDTASAQDKKDDALPGAPKEKVGTEPASGAIKVIGAEEFGIRLSDRIIEIDGKPIAQLDALTQLSKPGSKVKQVTILRSGRKKRLNRVRPSKK